MAAEEVVSHAVLSLYIQLLYIARKQISGYLQVYACVCNIIYVSIVLFSYVYI